MCSYVDIYLYALWIAFPSTFRILIHSMKYAVCLCILLLFNLLVFCILMRSVPTLAVSSFRPQLHQADCYTQEPMTKEKSLHSLLIHWWLRIRSELSDCFFQAHSMFNYVDISSILLSKLWKYQNHGMTWEEFHFDEMKNTKILLLRKKMQWRK